MTYPSETGVSREIAMPIGLFALFIQKEVIIPMRRFYALGVLAATAVAATLGLKVTEARAHCPVEDY